MALTKKQKQVLDYIVEYTDTHSYSPTQTEIMEHFNLKSLGSVQRYIKYLTNGGYINTEPNARRGIEISHFGLGLYSDQQSPSMTPEVESRVREVPLMGSVAAGSPIEAVKHFEFVDVPQSFLRGTKNYFALQVSGSSMIEDGIFDGDTIIVQQQSQAERGETVVALIGSEATVKRYQPFSDRIELHPANSTMEPIIVSGDERSNLRVLGKLAALLRNYD